jgi:hypothetical protein
MMAAQSGERRLVKKLLFAAACALAPATALAADFNGACVIHGDVGGAIQWTSDCDLKQDAAGKLSGACKGTQNEDAAVTGQATATSLELAYDTTYQGSPVHLDYKGDVQPDGSVKGAVDTGGPPGTFTLTKGAAATAAAPPAAGAPASTH